MSIRQSPLLSLVITAYTTERLSDIYELLESVKNQTLKNMETIFVTERSQLLFEKVKAYAEEKAMPNMTVVFNDGEPGQSPARNLGVKHSSGDIIAFVDDDVVLFPDWAEEMVKTYHDDSIIGVTGPAFPLWEDESMSWLPEEFYWIISCTAFLGLNEFKPVRCAGGMNMSFRKEAFDHVRFSEIFGHVGQEQRKVGPVVDDAEFSINLRMKTKKLIMYNPQVQVYHKVYKYRLSKKFIRGQSYWQGYSKALLKKMYPNDADMKALVREFSLLKRILSRLIPSSLINLFRKPKAAGKQLSLTFKVLCLVALGYSAGAFPKLMGFTKKYYLS